MRFHGFTDQWNSINFKNLFTYIPNNTLSRADLNYDAGDYKNVHYGDVLIKFGPVLDAASDELPFITDASAKKLGGVVLMDGDVIIADTAEDEAVGKATEIINVGDQQIVSGLHTIACRPAIKMAPTYLGFYLNAEAYHKQLYALMQGVKVLSISKSNIEDTVIRYPTSPEQKRICDLLNLLEARIARQRKLIEHLKKYKRGVQKAIFNATNNGNNMRGSSNWRAVPFGDAVIINPKTPALPEKFIYIDLESVESGKLQCLKYISKADAPSRAQRVLTDNDVLFQMVRPYQKNNFFFRDVYNTPVVASTGYAQIRCVKCDPTFVFEQISSDYFSQEAMLRSTGTGYPAINADSLAEIPFFLPPLDEQVEIGALLSALGSKIMLENDCLEMLMKLKTALLQQLFV